jgi:hypothetical protein
MPPQLDIEGVLRPGTSRRWVAFSSQHSTWSSSSCQTGFQEHPVDSIPTPGHPVAGQPLGQQQQPGGHRRERARLAPTSTILTRHPDTGGHRVLVHVQASAALDQRLHLLAPPYRQRVVAIRRSLYQGNLSLVLAATVRGTRGSHVRPISGLAAPRSTDVGRMTSTFSSIAGARPRPWEAYQQSRAKRCADRRFPRSLASVRGEVMRSYRQAGTGARTRCRNGSKLFEPLGRRQGDGAAGWARQPHWAGDPGLVERLLCKQPRLCAVRPAVLPGRRRARWP